MARRATQHLADNKPNLDADSRLFGLLLQVGELPSLHVRYDSSEALYLRKALNPRSAPHRAILRQSANPGEAVCTLYIHGNCQIHLLTCMHVHGSSSNNTRNIHTNTPLEALWYSALRV